ncbi:MAG: hypothetical protein LBJ92_00760 [Holosporales bacterium]|jgi:hypothetical protein|nr:hypothetical protein [Holosporales bacterium]
MTVCTDTFETYLAITNESSESELGQGFLVDKTQKLYIIERENAVSTVIG